MAEGERTDCQSSEDSTTKDAFSTEEDTDMDDIDVEVDNVDSDVARLPRETMKKYEDDVRRDYPGLYELNKRYFENVVGVRVRRDRRLHAIGGDAAVRAAAAERAELGPMFPKYSAAIKAAIEARHTRAQDAAGNHGTRDGAVRESCDARG